MLVGDVLVVGGDEVAGEAALFAHVQLAAALLVAVDQLDAVQLALVRLQRTALSERLVTPTTPIRTNACNTAHTCDNVWCLTELRFHVPLDTKWAILETFFPADN